MQHLTEKDVQVISSILRGEELACKKARIYANTLTDTALVERLTELGKQHEERFDRVLALLGGKQ
ncbi:MAG: hypothetical protein ACI4U2_06260 [Christensenellaceae bacterium]